MDVDRLRARLHNLEADVEPRAEFVERLHDELAEQLGFTSTGTDPSAPRARPTRGNRATTVRRLTILVAAALLLAGLLANAAAIGARVERLLNPVSLLAEARAAGALRIAVSPDAPQVQTPTRGIDGFDIDVAEALASRLGVRPDVRVTTPEEMLAAPGSGWHVALPGVGIDPVATYGLLVTQAYYRWPVYLVALPGPPSAGGLAPDATVCVEADSPGAAWANGATSGPALQVLQPRLATAVVVASDEATCVMRVEAGEADAMVTSTLLPADLETTGTLVRVVPGPVAVEPRVMIVPAVAGGPSLRDALDRAITDLVADGTLADLARTRLGTDSVVDLRQP